MKDQLSILNYQEIMKKTNKDYIRNTDFKIYQDDEMFCINTDTVLLGEFLDFRKGLNVLDIGTNNGALLLYASTREPLSLCGIDIFDEAISLASLNLKENNVKATLKCGRVQDFKHDPFDIIITNPPFFENNNPRLNEYKRTAMFEKELNINELFTAFKRLLKDNGYAYVIYPTQRFSEFYGKCLEYKYNIQIMKMVYDKNKNESTRFLCRLKRGPMTKTRVLKPIIVDGDNFYDLSK